MPLEIRMITTSISTLFPIIQIAEGNLFLENQNKIDTVKMNKARKSMEKLTQWINSIENIRVSHNTNKTIKQKLLREIGLIDIIITLFHKFYSQNLIKIDNIYSLKFIIKYTNINAF